MELQLLIRRDDPSLDTIPVVNNRELSLAVAKQTIVTRTEELVSEEVIDIIFARLSKGEPGKSAYQAAVEAGYTLSEAEFNRDLATISELAGAVEDKVGKEEFNTLKEDVENITAEYKDQLDNLEQTLDGKVDKVDGKQLSTEDFTTEYKEQLDTLIENGGNGSDGELRELFNLMFEYDSSLNAIHAKLPLYSLGSITAKGQGASSGSGGGGTAYNRLDNWNDYGEGKEGYVLSAYLGYSLREQFLSTIDGFNTNIDSLISFKETFEKMFSLDTDNVIKAKLPLYSLGSITAKGKGVSSGSGGGDTAYDRLDNWSDYGEGKEGYVLSAYLGYSLYEQLLNKLDANGTAKDSEKLGGLYASNYVTNDGLSDLAHKTGTYEDLIAGGLVGYTLPTRAQNQTIALAAKGDIPQEISDLSDGETILSAIDGFNTNIDSLISFKETFEKMFSLDTDNVIKAKLPLYSLGSITAKGKGASSGGGGGGAAYDRLDSWADYTTDKAGYVLSAGLGWDLNTRISNKFDSANFTKANLKNTLGISDWALAATKPSYTAAEVGALAVGGTAVNSDKLNGLSKSDFVRSYGDVGANYSKGNWVGYSYVTETHGGSTVGGVISAGNEGWGFQLNGSAFNDGVYYRAYSDGTFNTWRKLAFTSDIPTKLSQFTDDVVAGKYLPLSGGNIVSDKELILTIISSSPNSYAMFYANGRNRASVGYYKGLGYIANEISYARIGVTDTGEPQYWDSYRTDANKYTLLHSGNIGNYNAGSATKLQTPRSLWGQSFDGTGSITGHLWSDTWRIVTDATFDGTFFQSKNYEGTSNAGNIYLTGWDVNTLESFNVRAKNSKFSDNVTVDGNVGIGNESPTEKLDVSGNIKASGNITANKFIGHLRGDIIYDNGVDEGHFIGLGSNGVGVKGLLNYVYGNFPILFYTNGFERMRIGEYVGIGTTSPTERLDVSGNIKASGNINATSITINGVTITASNGSITVNGNVFATGSITAKKSA